jgi:hypothetical protein
MKTVCEPVGRGGWPLLSSWIIQREKNPGDTVSHHDLINILVEHLLHIEGRTWNNVALPPVILSEDEVVAFPTLTMRPHTQ